VHIHICYERLLPTFKKLSVVLGYLFDSEAERLSFHSKVKSQLDDPDYKDTVSVLSFTLSRNCW